MARHDPTNYLYGHWAEEQACKYLQRQQLQILQRRYRNPEGEVDIIALDPNQKILLAVEVKARHQAHTELLWDNIVTPRQQRRIVRGMMHFLGEHAEYADYTITFNLVVLQGRQEIFYLPNAWMASDVCNPGEY